MKRSITCAGWTLGSAALIALGLGCSRSRPAQTPPSETTSPTFESNVPTPAAPGAGQEAPAPPPGPPGAQAPAPPPPPGPAEMAPSPGGAPQATEAPAPAVENERQLCDTLSSEAKIHVEDVQNGAAIVIVPRAGRELSTVRDTAHRVEGLMRQHSVQSAPGPDTCGLFSIARLPSVTVTMSEGASSVRILLTTSNGAQVKDLRRIAHDQVTSMSKTRGHGR